MDSNQADLRLDRAATTTRSDAGPSRSRSGPTAGTADLVADVIRESGLMPADKVELVRHRAAGESFSQALVDEGLANALGVARRLAEQYQLPLVDLAVAGVDGEASKAIALPVLERTCAIPFASDGTTAQARDHQPAGRARARRAPARDPSLGRVLHRGQERRPHRAAAPVASGRSDERTFARRRCRGRRRGDRRTTTTSRPRTASPTRRSCGSSTPLIFQAAEEGRERHPRRAAARNELVIRYRIDGVLHVAHTIPKRLAAGVTTRLKVLAKLDIAERRKPQDGRITLAAAAAGRMLDIRVATLPTRRRRVGHDAPARQVARGPDARDPRALRGDAEADGQDPRHARPARCSSPARPARASRRRSTRRLAEISRPEINIITVEDPVEYRLNEITQVQINPRAGLTFATALRSILRSDPDVVMVGEIRDGETAKISIEAALTGHFVLSTLHTNDAPSAIDASDRDGGRAVHRRRRGLGRARAAARPQALPALRRALRADAGRAQCRCTSTEELAEKLVGSLVPPQEAAAPAAARRATRAASASSSCSR